MKLRIRGNSIRFRLSQTEMIQLVESGTVRDSIEFGPEVRLSYQVEVRPVGSLQASFTTEGIQITIPTAMARRWAEP